MNTLPSCQRACSAALLWVYRYLEDEDPQGIWSQVVQAVFARGRVTDQVSCPNRELLAVAPHHALTLEDQVELLFVGPVAVATY